MSVSPRRTVTSSADAQGVGADSRPLEREARNGASNVRRAVTPDLPPRAESSQQEGALATLLPGGVSRPKRIAKTRAFGIDLRALSSAICSLGNVDRLSELGKNGPLAAS